MLILLLESNWAAGVSAKNARFVAPTVIIYDMPFFMECNHCSAIYMNQVIAFFLLQIAASANFEHITVTLLPLLHIQDA